MFASHEGQHGSVSPALANYQVVSTAAQLPTLVADDTAGYFNVDFGKIEGR